MENILVWLEAHDGLSGWAQFIGAMLALLATYLIAFIPSWQRKRRLRDSAQRVLTHGLEMIMSYQRALKNFTPFPASIRLASISLATANSELTAFPVFELDDQSTSNSIARRIMSMKTMILTLQTQLDEFAQNLEGTATDEEHQLLLSIVEIARANAEKLVRGETLQAVQWENS